MADQAVMRRANALARRVRSRTFPNPWVGAVIASGTGDIIGKGATAAAGGPHAEVVALTTLAEQDLSHATLFVTLEPCAHHGRTPPCVDAIVSSGIRRVVIGVIDPDPKVSGRGVSALRAAGVQVEVGVLEEEVFECLYPYLAQRIDGSPYVSAKVAMSLDGKVADRDGVSQWITSAPSRDLGHRYRELSQAVVIGRGTYETDHPRLTARPGGRDSRFQPRRYVFARSAEFFASEMTVVKQSPKDFVQKLGAEGILRVHVEGGPTLLGSFLEAGLVDELFTVIAPIVLGDAGAVSALSLGEPRTLESALSGQFRGPRAVGSDVVFSFFPSVACERRLAVHSWMIQARQREG